MQFYGKNIINFTDNKPNYTTMKIDRKDQRITVRLTPNQYLELETLAKQLNLDKAKVVRSIFDEFFKSLNQ